MTDVSNVAVDDALFGEVLPPDLARVRESYGMFKLATVEFAEACLHAQRNGRSLRQIAKAAGCSHMTVKYVIDARVKSFYSDEPFSEIFTSITNTGRKVDSAPDPQSQLPEPEPEITPHRDGLSKDPDPHEGSEQQPGSDRSPFTEDEADTADDPASSGLEVLPAPSPVNGEPEPGAPPEPATQGVRSRPDAARGKLDRLRQMADEAERENPEEPVAELLDLQRALRALISKTRLYRGAGLEINAPALIGRIDSLYHEWRGLL